MSPGLGISLELDEHGWLYRFLSVSLLMTSRKARRLAARQVVERPASYLRLMYFPSPLRSRSDTARSEPARSLIRDVSRADQSAHSTYDEILHKHDERL